MPILVGTSGWSYEDWEGVVYPKGLAPAERLGFLAERFPALEIDASFYRDPTPALLRGWIARTRDRPGFELSLKAPQDLTHDAMAGAPPEACARLAASWRARVAEPLREAGRLGAVLLQLSPAVTHAREMQDRLAAALDALAPLPVAVEFRNRTWHDEAGALKPDALALLDARNAAAVVVDGPGFPAIVAGAADHAYVRFHGRNREHWFRRDATREERYDWDYAEAELAPWTRALADLAASKRVVRTFFNNHVGGQAFRNAQALQDLLERAGASVQRARGPQRRLF
jgi:uncharacterized protein YecE (DUF72 family)